jgi:hypothetical protein
MDIPEQRTTTLTLHTQVEDDITSRFSSFGRLQRVIAYCLRFVYNAMKHAIKNTWTLSVLELNEATACCTKIAQRHAYAQELLDLTNKEVISTKSRLQNLNSVLDAHQVLRVGGILQLGSLPYD